MASLQQESTGMWHVIVRIEGIRFKRSLKTKTKSKAEYRCTEIQEMVDLISRGRIEVPDDVSIIEFVLANGKVAAKPESSQKRKSQSPALKSLFKQFFDSIPPGSIEESTIKTMKIHERHLLRILKTHFDMGKLTGQHLQEYVNRRALEENPISG